MMNRNIQLLQWVSPYAHTIILAFSLRHKAQMGSPSVL